MKAGNVMLDEIIKAVSSLERQGIMPLAKVEGNTLLGLCTSFEVDLPEAKDSNPDYLRWRDLVKDEKYKACAMEFLRSTGRVIRFSDTKRRLAS